MTPKKAAAEPREPLKDLEPVTEQVKGGVTAPRDAASGLATGKRAHRPV